MLVCNFKKLLGFNVFSSAFAVWIGVLSTFSCSCFGAALLPQCVGLASGQAFGLSFLAGSPSTVTSDLAVWTKSHPFLFEPFLQILIHRFIEHEITTVYTNINVLFLNAVGHTLAEHGLHALLLIALPTFFRDNFCDLHFFFLPAQCAFCEKPLGFAQLILFLYFWLHFSSSISQYRIAICSCCPSWPHLFYDTAPMHLMHRRWAKLCIWI